VALAALEGLAVCSGDRQTGNGDRVAPTRIPAVFGAGRAAIHKAGPQCPGKSSILIRKMSVANPRWGAPRIHRELLKLGFELSEAMVAKYMVRHRRPPSQVGGLHHRYERIAA
jgi:hypothetical protein